MAYSVVGFSAELDRRPLLFVKPLPPHRVCDVCGLVRKKTALLPCKHTLCDACYEQRTRDNKHVCPLDGHQFEEDVAQFEFPAEQLLSRMVRRWNEGSGCGSVLTASQIAQHFQSECQHHSTRCPRCSATVLISHLCTHLEMGCVTTARAAGPDCEGDARRTNETALAATLGPIVKRELSRLKTLLEPILSSTGANRDQLNEVVNGMNRREEVLNGEIMQCIRQLLTACRANSVRINQVAREVNDCRDVLKGELIRYKEQLLTASGANSDELNDVGHLVINCHEILIELLQNVRSGNHILKHEVAKARTEQLECLKKCCNEIAAFNDEKKRHLNANNDSINFASKETDAAKELLVAGEKRDHGSKVDGGSEEATELQEESSSAVGRMDKGEPAPPDIHVSVCEFHVKRVNTLQEEARMFRVAVYESEKVYLRGYCMSPGVHLLKSNEITQLHARFTLYNGVMDDSVEWPLKQAIKLRVVHPKEVAERDIVYHTRYSAFPYERPQEGHEECPFFSEQFLHLEHLIRDGYVEDDQLLVKIELLPVLSG